jgi:hypothetical protein
MPSENACKHTHKIYLLSSHEYTNMKQIHAGSGSDLYNESETITKFEIMDGDAIFLKGKRQSDLDLVCFNK